MLTLHDTMHEPSLSLRTLPDSQAVVDTILQEARVFDDPEYAKKFYAAGVIKTNFRRLDDIVDGETWVKEEHLQDSGSYKRRGATRAMLESDQESVVTFSTGNHGLAVAMAGLALGREVHVELPEYASQAKIALLEATNAKLHFHTDFLSAQRAAAVRAREVNALLLPPFGGMDTVVGQSSLGKELVENLVESGLEDADVDIVFASAGFGLGAGIVTPIWEAKQTGVLGPGVRAIAVQPNKTNALGRAVARIHSGQEPKGLFAPNEFDADCDALAITEESLHPLTVALAADARLVSQDFPTIDKLSLAYARQYLSSQLGQEMEPAAALPMAYALQHNDGRTKVLVASGSNISPATKQIYDDLVLEENIRRFRELSKPHDIEDAHEENSLEIAPLLDKNEVKGVWSSAVTRRHVRSAAEQKAARSRNEAQLAYIGQLVASGIELATHQY